MEQKEILQLKEEKFPFVLIDRHLEEIDTNYVVVDNYQGALKAVNHLVGLGFKRIGHLTISPAHLSTLKRSDTRV